MLLLIVAIFELFDKVEYGLDLFLLLLFLTLSHIAFNWLELRKLKNELGEV